MQQYIQEVKKIFSSTANQDGFLGIRACHKELHEVQSLILGINPSNSIKAFGRNEFSQHLRTDDSAFFDQVLSSQTAYDEFLSFAHYQKNEARICELATHAHTFHPHFQKHSQFAKALGIDKQYAFFDLFPIWEIQQAVLINKLDQKPAVSEQLITAFVNMLKVHPQIQQLYFFNKKSYHLFLEFITIHSTVQILDKKELEFQIGRQKKSSVFETTIQLGAQRTIQVIAFGIGSYSFGTEACQELAKNYLIVQK